MGESAADALVVPVAAVDGQSDGGSRCNRDGGSVREGGGSGVVVVETAVQKDAEAAVCCWRWWRQQSCG